MRLSRWTIGWAAIGGAVACSTALAQVSGAEGGISQVPTDTYRTIGVGLTAALVMVGSVIGASYAVARIGSAALGAAAEKPELLTRSLVYVALAEGLAVLGFAIAMMLVQKM